MTNSTTYCKLCDIGIATQNNGSVAMCNLSKTQWRDNNGQVIRLNTHTLEQAWTSPTRIEISDALKSGVQHPNCRDCWDEETAGKMSKRIESNANFAEVEVLDHPRAFFLKPGNTCNLSCRHCNPETSSGWYRDYFNVEATETEFPVFVQRFAATQDSYRDESTVWPTLLKWSQTAVFYDLYGAEPMLIKPQWEMLRAASTSPTADTIDIHISTNGTIWKDEYYEVFKSFQSVRIGISVDGLDAQFNYMRYPADWLTVSTNIQKYKELSDSIPSIDSYIESTVSLLNVYYANDIWNYFNTLGIHTAFNMLHQPKHLNMRIAPDSVKYKITEHLQKNPNHQTDHIVNLLNLPMDNSELLLTKFWAITAKYDEFRQENYADTFPEMYQLLTRK
jgi:sulfatase maturation enzyme AslB (radical SAM superfamily)